MIECQDVRLTYRKKEILCGVNFSAKAGEITILLGRNGSGKTSLLRCIAGNRHHCRGKILICSHVSNTISPAKRAQMLSVMPQTLPLPAVTVSELVAFGRQPYLRYGSRLSERDIAAIAHAMERSGIAPHGNDLVSSLSGGERQLAFFTMLLAQDTPIVLLDEPTANLDAEYRRTVYCLMQQMRDCGKTVVATLHSLDDAVTLADQIYVLERGKLCFSGTPAEFIASKVPQTVFGLHPVQVSSATEGAFTVFRMNS